MDKVNEPSDVGTDSREEKERLALLKITITTVRHFFGGFSPSVS